MLIIEKLKDPVGIQKAEMVETKIFGHPDHVIDTLCELSSKELAKYYIKNFNHILHYNIDKGLIMAGHTNPKFKGGNIVKPIKVLITGQATAEFEGNKIPVDRIIKKACRNYLKQFKHAKFKIKTEIKEGSSTLQEVTRRDVANDTSFGCSHYPFSKLENLVTEVASYLKSEHFRNRFPNAGYDIKVMGVRIHEEITLTVALAFIDKFVNDMQHYIELKDQITEELKKKFNVNIVLNNLDDYKDEKSIYLTVSGLSAEQGDDGAVGRGNRYNELITPNRPMSLEAVSGKNTDHPGKLYQVLSYKIAKALVEKAHVKEAEVSMITQIGAPLNKPLLIHLNVLEETDKIKDVVDEVLNDIKNIQHDLIFG